MKNKKAKKAQIICLEVQLSQSLTHIPQDRKTMSGNATSDAANPQM